MPDYIYYMLACLLVALQGADGYTTLTALSKGARELNPIAKLGMEKLGKYGFFIAKAGYCAALGWLGLYMPYREFVIAPLAAFYCWVVGNNLMQIKKLGN